MANLRRKNVFSLFCTTFQVTTCTKPTTVSPKKSPLSEVSEIIKNGQLLGGNCPCFYRILADLAGVAIWEIYSTQFVLTQQ